jgi:hypothetical protein
MRTVRPNTPDTVQFLLSLRRCQHFVTPKIARVIAGAGSVAARPDRAGLSSSARRARPEDRSRHTAPRMHPLTSPSSPAFCVRACTQARARARARALWRKHAHAHCARTHAHAHCGAQTLASLNHQQRQHIILAVAPRCAPPRSLPWAQTFLLLRGPQRHDCGRAPVPCLCRAQARDQAPCSGPGLSQARHSLKILFVPPLSCGQLNVTGIT